MKFSMEGLIKTRGERVIDEIDADSIESAIKTMKMKYQGVVVEAAMLSEIKEERDAKAAEEAAIAAEEADRSQPDDDEPADMTERNEAKLMGLMFPPKVTKGQLRELIYQDEQERVRWYVESVSIHMGNEHLGESPWQAPGYNVVKMQRKIDEIARVIMKDEEAMDTIRKYGKKGLQRFGFQGLQTPGFTLASELVKKAWEQETANQNVRPPAAAPMRRRRLS